MTNNESTSQNKTDTIRTEAIQQLPPPQASPADPLSIYLAVLEIMRRPNKHVTAAPTFTPRSFAESIQFYDDEAVSPTRRVYFYINGGWRYVTAT
jgi:hypothetical protein